MVNINDGCQDPVNDLGGKSHLLIEAFVNLVTKHLEQQTAGAIAFVLCNNGATAETHFLCQLEHLELKLPFQRL